MSIIAENGPACGDTMEQEGWQMRCGEPFGHEGRHAGPAVNYATSQVAMLEWAHPGEPAYDEAEEGEWFQ